MSLFGVSGEILGSQAEGPEPEYPPSGGLKFVFNAKLMQTNEIKEANAPMKESQSMTLPR